MKKIGFLLVICSVVAGSCKQADQTTPCNPAAVTVKAPAAEIAALKNYIDTSKVTATPDDRGFYYTISKPGTGTKPTVCSSVTVNYSGKLTNGTVFDSNSGISFDLYELIVGWQEGIPLVAPGGSITLYLPPSLAYGAQA